MMVICMHATMCNECCISILEPVQPLVQQNSPASSSQTISLSQKIRIISTTQSSSSYPKNKYEYIYYESFPLTRELLQTRKNSLNLELFHTRQCSNVSTHNNIQTEKQEESIQTECSFFDRCDEATQTESSDVERCCCIIS